MVDRVLDQWLEKEVRQGRVEDIRPCPHIHTQAIAQPGFFDVQVGGGESDFLGHADFMPMGFLQRGAEEIAEAGDHAAGFPFSIVGDEGGDGVEGIEEEVRL